MTDLIQEKIQKGIEEKIFSGAQFLVGRGEEIIYEYSGGTTSFDSKEKKITEETLFDVASLTKPIATASAYYLLLGEKKIKLDNPVARFFPEWIEVGDEEAPRKKVTLRHLNFCGTI